jgi:hypothetical protein
MCKTKPRESKERTSGMRVNAILEYFSNPAPDGGGK